MPKPYSIDLRARVIEAVAGGSASPLEAHADQLLTLVAKHNFRRPTLPRRPPRPACRPSQRRLPLPQGSR